MNALVLALNPSIDAEWRVQHVLWEEKNNVLSERRWAGGKGINVARWLKHLGGRPLLLVPLGGNTGQELAGYLRGEKIPAQIIRLRQPTRVNIIVTTQAGRQMRFNPLGPRLSRREWVEIFKRVEQILRQKSLSRREAFTSPPGFRLRQSSGALTQSIDISMRQTTAALPDEAAAAPLLILSGSLPRGVPVTAYAQLIRLAHQFGLKTLLDSDGPAFAAAVKAHPFLVKPNEHELAQWWCKPLRSEAEILCAAQVLSRRTGGWVLVSRGPKRALLVNSAGEFCCFTRPPRRKPLNTVGAGDATIAAVARQILQRRQPKAWLEFGLKIGSAATRCKAGQLP